MITLSVTSFNGQPSATALSASFDELGGTIGRADSNQFVLPDPDRAISRVHAQIAFRSGSFVVIDRGSNPILVNGQPVGSGREQPVAHGDELQIGGYVMAVKRIDTKGPAGGPAAAFADPFADLLGPASGAFGGAAGGSGSASSGRSNPLPDPLSMLGGMGAVTGGSARPVAPPPPPSPSSSSTSAAFAQGIPEDWDPFAPDPVVPKAGGQDFAQSLGRTNRNPGSATSGSFGLDPGAAAPAALIPELSGGASSLDDLFGLKPGAGSGADPFSNSALGAPMAQPNMAASHDPMASLNSAPRASAPSRSDAFSDLSLAFTAPPVIGSRPVPPTPAPAPAPAERAPAPPARAVLSWDAADMDGAGDSHGDGATLIRPAAAARVAELPVASPPPPAPAPAARAAPSAAHVTAHATAHATAQVNTDSAALLAALRDGLALPSLQIDALTPELMTLIGQLLHEAARGTVDLLVARAALKREVRAESTMIVARENNPLKFSPSVDAALQHLLAPPTRGFMPAAAAMRDAYDDLRAHQFGFIAGMRAALDGVLQRFDPSELEGRLAQRSVLQSLLPGSRKARMWEVFTEHYAQVRADASDDFHSLFGKAFLLAYEAHLDQLQSAAP